MSREKFSSVTFNDLDPSGTWISRSSEFSVVNSTEKLLLCWKAHEICHKTYTTLSTSP